MRVAGPLALFLGMHLACFAAHAQEPKPRPAGPSKASEPVFQELSIEELMEIEVTTATATAQPAAETPATVYVITGDVIERRGYTDLGELLADIPEIQIEENSQPEIGSVYTIRGINGNAKFIVLLDGIRMNSATGTPHSVRHSFSLANAERVEVVLGPGSALYGADAFTAVVNIITRSGDEVDGGRLRGSYGQFGTTDDSLVVGGQLADIAWAVSGSLYHSNEPTLPDYYPDEFAWYRERYLTRGEVRASLFGEEVVTVPIEPYAQPYDAYFLNGRLDFGELSIAYTRHHGRFGTSMGIRPEFALYVEDARQAFTIQSLSLEHVHKLLDDQLTLRSSLSTQSYEVDPNSQFINVFTQYRQGFVYESNLASRFEERVSYRLSDRYAASAGLVLEDDRALPLHSDLGQPFDPDLPPDSQGLIYLGSDVRDSAGKDLSIPMDTFDVHYQNLGAYAELVARPIDLLTVIAGTRFDHNTRYGNSFNPRAGLVLAPGAQTRIKLLYGQAFLAPSPYFAYQHFGSFVPAVDAQGEIKGLQAPLFFLPNPDLKPETLTMLELSATHRLGVARLSADAYHARVTDLQAFATRMNEQFKGWPVDTVLQRINRGRSTTFGGTLQLDVTWRPASFLVCPRLAYTFTDGDVDGEPLPIAAKHVLKAGLDLGWGKLTLSTRVLSRGSALHPSLSDADGDPLVIPGSTVVNLFARYADLVTLGRWKLSVFADVQNLFDERYFRVPNSLEQFVATPQSPRRVLLGASLDF